MTQAGQTNPSPGIQTVSRMTQGRKVIGGGSFGQQCPTPRVPGSHSVAHRALLIPLSPRAQTVGFAFACMNLDTLLQWADWWSPRYVHILISGTRVRFLIWEKSLWADVVKDLEMRSSWLIQVGLKYHHRSPCERGGHREMGRRGYGAGMAEAALGVMQPQAKPRRQPPEARRGEGRILPKSLQRQCAPDTP